MGGATTTVSISSSATGAYFNLLKSFLGIGILTFPYAFSLVGVFPAVTLLVVVVIAVRISMVQLIASESLLVNSGRSPGQLIGRHQPITFPDIARLGLAGWPRLQPLVSNLTLFVIVLGQLGTVTAYLNFVAANLVQLASSITGWPLSHGHGVTIAAVLLVPLVLIRSVGRLYPISVIGTSCLVGGGLALATLCSHGVYTHHVGSAISDAATTARPAHDVWAFHPGGLWRFLGIALFAAEGIVSLPSIGASLRRGMGNDSSTGAFMLVLDLALLTMTAALIMAGVAGWDCLGPAPPAIITAGLPANGWAPTFIRLALAVYILCTYPLQLFPAVEAMEPVLLALVKRLSPPAGHIKLDDDSATADGIIGTAFAGADDEDDEAAHLPPAARSRVPHRPSRANDDEEAGDAAGERLSLLVGGTESVLAYWAGTAFRLALLLLTAVTASSLSSFASVLSFLGWLAFGVLSFLVPPLAYVCQVSLAFSHDQLQSGAHWSWWRQQLLRAAPRTGSSSSGSSGSSVKSDGRSLLPAEGSHIHRLPQFFPLWTLERIAIGAYVIVGVSITIAGLVGVVMEAAAAHTTHP